MQRIIKVSELIIINNVDELVQALRGLQYNGLPGKPCITTPYGSINYMGFSYIQEMLRQTHEIYDFVYDVFMLRLGTKDNVFYESILKSKLKHILREAGDDGRAEFWLRYDKINWLLK